MLSNQGRLLGELTMYEKGRADELIYISGILRNLAAFAREGEVDPDELETWATVFDINVDDIVEKAKKSMRKGPAQIADGTVCLQVRGRRNVEPMRPDVAEDACRALEGAAVDVVRIVNSLYGLQASRYSDGLAMLADQLLASARSLRGMSEGMEDGDE